MMAGRVAVAALLWAGCVGYKVDLSKGGRVFDGIGGLSGGGATSRLLVDYKEPERSYILDYLFKPNFGASLQILKVEIGGDSQSTDGTEASHMHSIDDLAYDRGYEWWLMKEAKKRNPAIKLYGLPWSFPGWVGDDPQTGVPSGSPFTYPNQTAYYIAQWVAGAHSTHGLTIDYLGIWNERSCNASYVIDLKKTLRGAGFPDIKVVVNDGGAGVCNELKADPEYLSAVDIVGLHYPSDGEYSVCHSLGVPLWASEESSSYDDLNGAACWARVTNSHYVVSGMTASIMWNLVGSYYHGTNWYASSMLTAVQPWSGYIENLGPLWATAHTTQFTAIGWNYLEVGHGSGNLTNGGYYASLVSPSGDDVTILVVKVSPDHNACTRPPLPYLPTQPETATFKIQGPNGKVPKKLACWKSNYEAKTKLVFAQQDDVVVGEDGSFSMRIELGDYITLSTVRTARKGSHPNTESSPSFPLPHTDSFDTTPVHQEAPLCTDQIGSFEVVEDTRNTSNRVMRQEVPALPIGWSDHGSNGPLTLIGMKEWMDVSISLRIRLPSTSAHGCIGTRVNQMWQNGVVFCLAVSGSWNLSYGGPPLSGEYKSPMIASGTAKPFQPMQWVTVKLETTDKEASAWVDSTKVLSEAIRDSDNGFVAFGTNGWYHVEYDDLEVEKTGSRWVVPGGCNPKPGQVPAAKPCQPNGIQAPDQAFQLTSDYQIIHVKSGLCVTASSATPEATLALQPCTFGDRLQQFFHDYTRIRNVLKPMNLIGTSLTFSADASDNLGLNKTGGWARWAYFPNTLQLRNTYDTDVKTGYPLCLSAC